MAETEDKAKRRTLTLLAGAGAVGAAGIIGVPALGLISDPALRAKGEGLWVKVAKLDDLPENEPRRLKVVTDVKDGFSTARNQALGMVWVIRKGKSITAFSAVCPHAGCSIGISGDGKEFFCPCHSSSFTFDGKRAPGKPNKALRGMDPLKSRIGKDNAVEIMFQRFALGKESREVIG